MAAAHTKGKAMRPEALFGAAPFRRFAEAGALRDFPSSPPRLRLLTDAQLSLQGAAEKDR